MRGRRGRGMVAALLCAVALALPPAARAQQADDEPVGWPLPKSERPKRQKSDRTPLLPVVPQPQSVATGEGGASSAAGPAATEEEGSITRHEPGSESVPSSAASPSHRPALPAGRRAADDAAARELVPLREVTLGAKPLVFAFGPDQYALSADEVRLLERFAAGVRTATGIVDVLVWVTPPSGADEQARRKALERAFARGLYLRALLREAGLPAARIDILATARPAPREKNMPSPPPAEGARIRLVSNFMTGVR